MAIALTELHRHAGRVVKSVKERGISVDIEEHGRIVASISPKPRRTVADLVRALKQSPFSAADSRMIKKAIADANKAFE